MTLDRRSVFIGIPSEKGWVRSKTALSYAANLVYLGEMGYKVNGTTVDDESAFNARAILVEEARKQGAYWLAMMDDDMVVNPDVIYKLIQRNVDVIIPLTTSRKHPHPLVIYDLKPIDDPSGRFKHKYFEKSTVRHGLNECDGLGTGVVLFKTEIFDRILRPWFWTIPVEENEYGKLTQATGEDLFFCSRARNCGVKLHYDGDVQVGHIGPNVVCTPSLSLQEGTFKYED